MSVEPNESDPEVPVRKQLPVARLDSLKFVFFGIILLVIAYATWLIGIIPVFGVAIALLFGPLMIYGGLVQLILPQRLHWSPLHARLNYIGAVVILAILIGSVGWYLWRFVL